MAKKKYFIANLDKGIVEEKLIDYTFSPGFALKNKQKNILAVHEAINIKEGSKNILDISSRSTIELGIK
ncbi:MAG: DarT1-associated NADAR antitoxin family protein, partial [Cetobacterium sp.]